MAQETAFEGTPFATAQAEEVIEPVVETVTEEVTEPVVEEAVIEDAPVEVAEEIVEATEEAPEETTEDAPTEVEPAVIFDANEDLEELVTKVTPVLEKYELPADVQAVIDVLKTKAEAMPNDLQPYSDYGGVEEIKSLLERQSALDTAREVENGAYRPNTDKFVETLKDPETVQWLRYDLNAMPSQRYQGATAFEEQIIDALGKEGESANAVLEKYYQMVEHFKTNTFPTADVPQFIPSHLQEAYAKLSKDERNEIALLDPETYDEDKYKVQSKLQSLELIQQGIEGQKAQAQAKFEAEKAKEQQFTQEVVKTQVNFFNSFRDEIAKDLAKNVQFSTEPKLQTLLANQQIALLSEAFSPEGEWARQTLSESGINFDFNKSQQLVKDIERAAVQLIAQQRAKDSSGNPLNSVELNKATKEFERVAKNWQAFAKDIIDQEARLVSTGTAEAVKKQVEKIKIAPKARTVPKGTAGVSTGKTVEAVPAYGTPEWDAYRAKQVDTIWELAQKSQAYQ